MARPGNNWKISLEHLETTAAALSSIRLSMQAWGEIVVSAVCAIFTDTMELR